MQLFTCSTCILSLAVGQDFILSRTEVTFRAGTTDGNTIRVFVDILDDTLVEGTEDFTLTGSVAPPASFGSSITVSIIDDDGKCVCLCISISKLQVFSEDIPHTVFVEGRSSPHLAQLSSSLHSGVVVLS